MKRTILGLCLLLIATNALAYPFDVIITKSREQVQCIILSRTDEQITYQLTNDDSQTFTLSTAEVEKVYSRDNGPIISYVPEPEPAPVAAKKMETLIAEKPEPVVEKKEEPKKQAQEVAKEPEPVVEEPRVKETKKPEQKPAPVERPKASTEDELRFKRFMSTINGPDLEQYRAKQAKKAQKEETLKQNFISIFVTGLEDSQADIQQIIESEAFAKLSTIKDHKAKIEGATKGTPEDSALSIAKDHSSKYAFIVSVRPFQKQYYLQSKLFNAMNGELLISASAASSLTSLEDLLKTTDMFTNQVIEHFQKKEEEAKQEEDAELQAWIEECDRQAAQPKETRTSIFDDTYTLEIVNPKNYFCRVLVAGHLIGMVNPRSTQRFNVSVELYGKVQIIQNSGYQFFPAEGTFYIPKQSSKGVLTLTMDE